MCFSVITKNLKFSYFKRWDGVRDEKFEYCGSSLKNPIFRRGGGGGVGGRQVHEISIYRGEFPKKRVG